MHVLVYQVLWGLYEGCLEVVVERSVLKALICIGVSAGYVRM